MIVTRGEGPWQGQRRGGLQVGRLKLDWKRTGAGEPVALLHAAPFVDWYAALRARLAGWSVLTYRRRLDRLPESAGVPFDLAEDAHAFEQLARHLGIGPVHLVGHSYGALLALEIARRGGTEVRSLALIEPAGAGFLPPEQAAAAIAPLMQRYDTHGGVAALDMFLSTVCGPGYRDQLETAAPGAWQSGCPDADQFFSAELPAACRWTFGHDDAAALSQPTLVIVGTATDQRFTRAADLVQGWLRDVTRVDLPDANHLLIAQAPDQIAHALQVLWLHT
jgi:pimeloyl-ACP methyl ester carboxylesterase